MNERSESGTPTATIAARPQEERPTGAPTEEGSTGEAHGPASALWDDEGTLRWPVIDED